MSVTKQEGGKEERVDLASIPVRSLVDAGKYGLFLKMTSRTFLPVKFDRNGRMIGHGSTIDVDQFPELTLARMNNDETAAAPERHSLPSFATEIVGVLGSTMRNIAGKLSRCLGKTN
ncbi:MAG: hypothetical protein WCX61_03335 [Candidatus Peribacteraceae bacterium]|jgi:hypothetical protein